MASMRSEWSLNLSRGPIVPLAGLIQSLDSGKVIAAGLDVLENEKLSTLSDLQREHLNRLFQMEKVIFTPHIGGWSHESLDRINDRLVDWLFEFLQIQTRKNNTLLAAADRNLVENSAEKAQQCNDKQEYPWHRRAKPALYFKGEEGAEHVLVCLKGCGFGNWRFRGLEVYRFGG